MEKFVCSPLTTFLNLQCSVQENSFLCKSVVSDHSRLGSAVPLLDAVRFHRRGRKHTLRRIGRFIEFLLQLFELLLSLLRLLLTGLVFTAVVVGGLIQDESHRDSANEEKPEKVDGLQTGQKAKSNVLRDPALVLLSLPVELVGTDGLELGEDGPEDVEVDVVAQVGPDDEEDEEVGFDKGSVDVVEAFGGLSSISMRDESGSTETTYGEEEIGDVVCDIHGNSHVHKVEAVAQPDQADGDDVVRNELAPVLARLLEHQHQDNELLGPVAGLQQVVCLDDRLVRAVGEVLVHSRGVEVPDGRA